MKDPERQAEKIISWVFPQRKINISACSLKISLRERKCRAERAINQAPRDAMRLLQFAWLCFPQSLALSSQYESEVTDLKKKISLNLAKNSLHTWTFQKAEFWVLVCVLIGSKWLDEMVGWHHQLNGHEFEQVLGVGDRQGSLACCSSWGRKESDTTEQLNWLGPNISCYIHKCQSTKPSNPYSLMKCGHFEACGLESSFDVFLVLQPRPLNS